MLGTRVPFFARSGQLSLIIIAILSSGLSFWLSVRWYGSLAPGHALLELIAIAVTLELAKPTFGVIGARLVKWGTSAQKLFGYILVAVSTILAMGSTAASLAFFLQTDDRAFEQGYRVAQEDWP